MITNLNLGNFKSFEKLEGLRLAPLTILSGKNSCGKSSILQSLLLLKQSISGEPDDEALTLDGNFLQFSSLREVSYGLPSESSSKISYGFDLSDSDGPVGHLCFDIRHGILAEHSNRRGPVITHVYWKAEGKSVGTSVRRWKGEFRWPSKEKLDLPPTPKGFELREQRLISFERFLPTHLVQEVCRSGKEIKEGEKHLLLLRLNMTGSVLGDLSSLLKDELEQMKYLGPSRATPRRAYVHYAERHYDLDPDGGNAAHVFWLRQNEDVDWKGDKVPLKDAVSECFGILGFRTDITPRRSSNFVYQLMMGVDGVKGKNVTIADVGFGYSQVLPIILRGLLSERNALLLFEQPEIHLHPSAQAKLAELLIAFNSSGRRLIVETHSVELINGLQLQVIRDSSLSDKINVVFVESNSEENKYGAKINQLTLQPNGMFNEWPEGFCDESERLARAILEATVKKGKG